MYFNYLTLLVFLCTLAWANPAAHLDNSNAPRDAANLLDDGSLQALAKRSTTSFPNLVPTTTVSMSSYSPPKTTVDVGTIVYTPANQTQGGRPGTYANPNVTESASGTTVTAASGNAGSVARPVSLLGVLPLMLLGL